MFTPLNLRGGVKVPTGGNAEEVPTSPRADAPFSADADFGEIPEPTVTVRMVEDSRQTMRKLRVVHLYVAREDFGDKCLF